MLFRGDASKMASGVNMNRRGRTAEREQRLLRAARRGDCRARDRLVTSHLQLVRRIANRYRNLGLPFDDVMQEGLLGLLDAIARYEPADGRDFERFAGFRVRRAIRNALTDQSRLVRLPKHVVERRRALARAANGRVQPTAVLAAATGLPVQAVKEALSAEVTTMPLDAIEVDADPRAVDPERAALEHDVAERLDAALGELSTRERQIVGRAFGLDDAPEPISEIAGELGLSRERTRSILQTALADLRTALD
jgi:RNA polymerase sigma factor (sigma-70 family)